MRASLFLFGFRARGDFPHAHSDAARFYIRVVARFPSEFRLAHFYAHCTELCQFCSALSLASALFCYSALPRLRLCSASRLGFCFRLLCPISVSLSLSCRPRHPTKSICRVAVAQWTKRLTRNGYTRVQKRRSSCNMRRVIEHRESASREMS